MKAVKLSLRRKKIWFRPFIIFFCFIIAVAAVLEAGVFIFHTHSRSSPSAKKQDLSPLFSKSFLSQTDYDLLFEQTGLTEIAINSLVSQNNTDIIYKIQNQFLSQYTETFDQFAPFTCCHEIEESIILAPVENGDIIISPTTHFSFFNMGHAAIVVDAQKGIILDAAGYNTKSCTEPISELTERPVFFILRPKASKEVRQQISSYALQNLCGLDYSVSVGLIGKKFDQNISRTNCSHLVWYAFNKFGIDLDSNGGPFVFPSDIASSDQLELVQVFGVDPASL